MRVREIMKKKVYTVAPSESVVAVVNRFRANRIHHLVVANGSKVIGLVSHHDIHRAAEENPDRTHVSDVMTEDVVTIDADATVREAANKMRGNTIGCLPVTENKKLVGIITRSDLVDLIGRGALIPARKAERREMRTQIPGRQRRAGTR
ncbi:MAG TPA: CBS domain-containing protein [Thermoanaerobaculia bacterium]|jgi:CBS domain-containing protein|nr:CBS domain-containing protein [Thermoanaerobaculia bacterium]